ncbi:hypothetical protein GBAR_LOCUS5591, partial [Geodia barretti]
MLLCFPAPSTKHSTDECPTTLNGITISSSLPLEHTSLTYISPK